MPGVAGLFEIMENALPRKQQNLSLPLPFDLLRRKLSLG